MDEAVVQDVVVVPVAAGGQDVVVPQVVAEALNVVLTQPAAVAQPTGMVLHTTADTRG